MNPIRDCLDLQVNGYAGVDFNGQFTVDDLRTVCRRMRADGVSGFLATVITAPVQRMVDQIARLAAAIRSDHEIAETMIGIHVEGPFLSPVTGYVGAHPLDSIQSAQVDVAKQLIEAGQGSVKLLTLAPEQDPTCETIRWLDEQGIVVAAGHSDASLDHCNRRSMRA